MIQAIEFILGALLYLAFGGYLIGLCFKHARLKIDGFLLLMGSAFWPFVLPIMFVSGIAGPLLTRYVNWINTPPKPKSRKDITA